MLDPKMAYQAFVLNQQYSDQWNGIQISEANILHFLGSRDSDTRVEVMNQLAQQLSIPID
jgi:hypothetical protein